MSNRDVKRPQRIWREQEVAPAPPVDPGRAPVPAHERFSRLLQTPRGGESGASALFARSALKQPPSAPGNAPGNAPKRPSGSSTKEDPATDAAATSAPSSAAGVPVQTEPVNRKVGQPSSMHWSQAEPWHQAWRDSIAMAPRIEGLESQHWPDDVVATTALLCQRAGDQFTGWRVAVPLDPEALPETELWLEASPQRLSLRFRTLSAWSVRLILAHQDRLVGLLRQRLGASRVVDVEIT
jgi:hypothetical protein